MSKKSLDKKGEAESLKEPLTLTARVLEGEEKERIKPYLIRLKQAINEKEIRNIALIGNYGSGKSTILKTFQHYNKKEYKYLPITLALFRNYNEDVPEKKNGEIVFNNASENDKKDFDEKLELSILQQIFYREHADKIPGSRFKRINDFDNNKTFWALVFSTIWIISVLFLFGLNHITDIDPRYWDFNKSFSWYAATLFIVFSIGIYHFLKYGIRKFSNSKLNKVSFKGEFEFGDASVFNNYLDEIIYFFEKTEYNVVVFEDIDRFDTTRIFTKLRELNNLINNCEIIDREINFIYAINDTLFKDKTERVKFFDFIIPVIPFVNSKNASAQLNKLIQVHELTDKLPKNFITEVVSMIHDIDMRLLINTFHEYTVFKENIGDENINHKELFSIIIYKNLYPEDFSKLYHERGNLYRVISKREVYKQILTRKFKHDNKELEKKIESLEQHSHIKIKELRAVYILRFLEGLPSNVNVIYVDNNVVKPINLIEDENFEIIQEGKNIKYTRHGHSRKHDYDLKFNQLESLVNQKHTYQEREQLIEDRKKNKVNSIKNEITSNKNKIREINKLELAKIFELMNTDKVYGEFKDNDLVRYLLAGGYLNENYLDYISLFHEVNLTRDEFNYLRSIKSSKDPDLEFEISNHHTLITDLDVRYFSSKSILNYDLVDYLVSNSDWFPDKVSMLYASFENRQTIYFDFIINFIEEKPDCRRKFISNIIKSRKSFWDELFHDTNLPEEKILEIVKYLFEYSNADDLQQLENVESLRGYLEEIKSPIATGESLSDKKTFQEFLIVQDVKFKSLEKPGNSSDSFFNFVVKNNTYEINYSNIIVILNAKLSDVAESNISKSIYTHIRESELTELENYIEQNINEFVSKVLLHKKGSHSESEDSVVKLLNNKELKSEFKRELIGIQKHKISSLGKLDNYEEKQIVTSANKVKPTWGNVFHYYDQFDKSILNDTIIKFLNNEKNHIELSKSSLFDLEEVEQEKLRKFRDEVLYSDGLNTVAYKSLLKSLTPIDSVDFSQLNSEMAEIMLNENLLELKSHNYDGLKSLDGNLHIRLIEKYPQNFIENCISYSLDNNVWYLILSSKNIKTPLKRKLLSYFTIDELSNKNVAKKVLELHPDQKIEEYGFDEIKELLSHRGQLKDRISKLLKYLDVLNDDQLKIIVSQFGEKYAKLFKLRKMTVFPNNKEHKLILDELVNRGLINRTIPKGEKIKATSLWKK